jgi:cytochrome c peroxidase
MRGNLIVRHLRLPLLLLPLAAAIAAIAQVPPPPPQPLGPPPQPLGNQVTTAKANLGKALFWDEQLSATRTVACGSCHQSQTGGSDPRSLFGSARAANPGIDAIAGTADDILGSPGVPLNEADGTYAWSSVYGFREQVTGRLANSYINAAYSPELFWDGRAASTFVDPVSGNTVLQNGGALESQAVGPPVSSTEMAHLGSDWTEVAARVAVSTPLALSPAMPLDLEAWIAGRSYPDLFQEAFGSSAVTPARIALAIASYERTLFSNQTAFDSVLAGTATLSPQESQGMQLFGALPCAGCHRGGLMSDNVYHYIGVRPAAEDSGRAKVSGNPVDLGAFRTPSLRNVQLRSAYFHNGRFTSLADVVAFYNRGGDFNAPNKAPAIRPLNLNPGQQAALVAFLSRPLTDPRVLNSTAPFDHPLLYAQSSLVPDIVGDGVNGGAGSALQAVALEPAIAGNPRFTVGVFGALAGAEAVLVIDESEPPASGGIPESGSFARVTTTLLGAGDAGGYGSATVAIPGDAALLGRTLYGRWYVNDPGAADGVASSALIRFQVFGDHGSGVLVASVKPASSVTGRAVRLHASQPNPFRTSSTLRFDLFKAASVELVVHDVAGRTVRRVLEDPMRLPGSYSIAWDGRDDAGHLAPGGIYFYRLEVDGERHSARVVRLN